MLSPSIYHSTAERDQPSTKHRSTCVPFRVRQRKQADRVGASMSSSIYLQFAAFSKQKKKSKSAPPKNNTTTSRGWYEKDLPIFPISTRYNTLLSLSYIFLWCKRASSGLLFWSMQLLAFASRQFAPNLDLCPLHSHCCVLLFEWA